MSGAGKSSLARGGVAGEMRKGSWQTGESVATIETSPSELRLNGTRAPVLQLATMARAALGDPAFPGDGDQAAWDRCIDAGGGADPTEVARLIVSLVKTEVGRQSRHLFIVMDQAEDWWGSDGKFASANLGMLVFLDHLTRSKVVSCLTVLQSEPHTGKTIGGKLQSLRQLKVFQELTAAAPVEIEQLLTPPRSGDVREIVFGVVREQVGAAPPELETLVERTADLFETDTPFLPLLGLRLKRICDAFRAQNLDDGARARATAKSKSKSSLGADDPFVELGDEVRFAVEPWMVEPLDSEFDQLGDLAIGDIPPLKRDPAQLEAALDLCLSKLVGVDTGEAGPRRSDSCIRLDHPATHFGAPDSTERLLIDVLVRRRLVRNVGGNVFRISHLSIVDNWKRAGAWFDSTAGRRAAANRVATLVPEASTIEAIAENLRAPDNWQALRKVMHHIAQDSVLVPESVRTRKADLVAAMELSFARLTDVAEQNKRLNEAIAAGLLDFVASVLAPPGMSKRLDEDPSPAGAEPLLIRLARAGLLSCVERAARERCRRAALSPRTRESVFGLVLQRIDDHADAAFALFSLLDKGVAGKKGIEPLSANERSAVFDTRTKKDQKSLLDFAAMSGSGRAVKLVLSLAADDASRRALIDPHVRGATKTLKSPLFLAVETGKRSAVDVILNEAKKLLPAADLARHVNSMPSRGDGRQRREPAVVSAARSGKVEIVQALLAVGADPGKAGTDLCDAFQIALINDDTKVLAALLDSGGAPGVSPAGFALSHWAAVLNAKKCLQSLVVREGDSPKRDTIGRTALHVACARSRPDAVKMLLSTMPKKRREAWLSARDNRGQTALHNALRAGQTATAELLLEYSQVVSAINEADEKGYRPLHYAARFCGLDGVATLIEKGAERDFEIEAPAEITPLQVAAMVNDAEVCAVLTTAHSIAQRNPHNRNALHYAARHGAREALEQLLSVSAQELKTENLEGQTPLHLASYSGHEACVALLLRAPEGASVLERPDKVQEGGRGCRTPLWSAASAGHVTVVSRLVAAGADIEAAAANGLRPIDEACRKGHAEVVQALINAGADIGAGWLNNLPLHYACRGGHADVYDVLAKAIAYKGPPDALAQALRTQTQFGETPLQALARALVRSGAPKRLSEHQRDEGFFVEGSGEVLSFTAPPKDSNDEASAIDLSGAAAIIKQTLPRSGETLDERTLHDLALGCAALGDADVIRLIASAGVRFQNVRDQFGATPLHLAAKSGAVHVLEALIAAGADVNSRAADGGSVLQTLVLHTSARDFEHGAQALLANGADVNAADVFGESVLHKIAACKSLDLTTKCKYLCDRGADINLKNADGETPRGVLAHVRRKMASSRRLDLKEEIEILDRAFVERGGSLAERTPSEARLQRVAYPVHNVIMSSRWDLIPKIMTHGAGHCAAAADSNGRTPMMAMASAAWVEKDAAAMNAFFDWLITQSNDFEACDHTGRTVAHYACLASGADPQEGTSAALQRLPRQVDLGAVDGLGRVPLHTAASVGNVAAIEWLIKRGQKVDFPDAFGNLAVHLAALARQDRAYDALNALGALRERKNAVGISAEDVRTLKADAVRVHSGPVKRAAAVESPRHASKPPKRKRQGGALIWAALLLLIAAVAGAIAFAPAIRDELQRLIGG